MNRASGTRRIATFIPADPSALVVGPEEWGWSHAEVKVAQAAARFHAPAADELLHPALLILNCAVVACATA